MKVKDFEKAIEALNCAVVMDEVKIQRGHVRHFFGHKGSLLLMWDENGRGYSVESEDVDLSMEASAHCYERDVVYDLKFE